MPTRKTEARLPAGFSAADLGETASAGPLVLVSYLNSPLAAGAQNTYVVFALGAEDIDEYRWSVASPSGTITRVTTVGSLGVDARAPGALVVRVEARHQGGSIGEVELQQSVVQPDHDLQVLLETLAPSAINQHVLSAVGCDPQTAWELVNDFRAYIYSAAAKTPNIPTQLLAAIAYKESLNRPKAFSWLKPYLLGRFIRTKEIEDVAEALNSSGTLLANTIGVCQIHPGTAAMQLGLIERRVLPSSGPREETRSSIASDVAALTEDEKIDIFNVRRFPKSNISLAAQILQYLFQRRYTHATAAELFGDLAALQLIATEYNLGATDSATEQAGRTDYGRGVGFFATSSYIPTFFTAEAPSGPGAGEPHTASLRMEFTLGQSAQGIPPDEFQFLVGDNQAIRATVVDSLPSGSSVAWTVTPVGTHSGTVPLVDTTGSGSEIVFTPVVDAAARDVSGSRRPNPPVGYDIVATIQTPGLPVRYAAASIEQDEVSVIRQEYLDFRRFRAGFTLQVPTRQSIQTPERPELASNFCNYTMIRDEGALAVFDQTAAEFPDAVLMTSLWRNPRRNRAVGGAVNSNHQLGRAVDLRPENSARIIGPERRLAFLLLYRAAIAQDALRVLLEQGGTQLLPAGWDPPQASAAQPDLDGDGLPDAATGPPGYGRTLVEIFDDATHVHITTRAE